MTLDEVHRLIAERDPDPVAFGPDAPNLPWGEEDFSRLFYEHHTRPETDTQLEVDALLSWLELIPGQRVLDLGCGGGRTLKALGDAGIKGAGIDVGPFPVREAQRLLKGLPMTVHQGDMRTALPEGPFDAAFCIFGQLTCFEEADARRILEQTRRALRPGGRLVVELYLGPQTLLAMDGMQEWMVCDEWLGGRYPQLVMDEHLVNWHRSTYVRRSYVLGLGAGGPPLQTFVQCSEIYDGPRLTGLLEDAGFEVGALYGDWDGEPFDEDALNLLALARAVE